MPSPLDTLVIGAGISGLSCAWSLHRAGRSVRVIEAGPEVGGSLRSTTLEGATIDLGPQTIHSGDPDLLAHFDELGLTPRMTVAGAQGRKRFIVRDGALAELPSSPISALTTPALSWRGKLRLLAEPFARPGPGGDESAMDFVTRRLGPEVAQRLLDPFVSGVHAGDPETLSMRGAFPRLLDAERTHGSLVRWALAEGRRARRRRGAVGTAGASADSGRRRTRLFSFKQGLQEWPRAIAEQLGPDAVELGTPAERIHSSADTGWIVDTPHGSIHARHVVVATPAATAAQLIAPVSEGGARVLRDMPYSPVATVHLLYRRGAIAHPLDGFGLLIPGCELRPVLGILWISSLFEGRAPAGTALTTSFIGGARAPERMDLDDAELIDVAHDEHVQLLGATERPIAARVGRWPLAIPRVEFGHVERLEALERMEQLHPGLHLAGSYGAGGAAVPKCWARGVEVAERILAEPTQLPDGRGGRGELSLLP
jgi:oxygen-dependent protoporphyrinogen oxidase